MREFRLSVQLIDLLRELPLLLLIVLVVAPQVERSHLCEAKGVQDLLLHLNICRGLHLGIISCTRE